MTGSASRGTDLVHGTVVMVDGRGVIICGPSGSGKTMLALELLARCRQAGVDAALVADDYAFLAHDGEAGSVSATCPDAIAGMVELRGFGPVTLDPDRHRAKAALSLAVDLVDPVDSERVAEPGQVAEFCGVAIPRLALPQRTPVGSIHAIFGWLGLQNRFL